MAGRRRIEKLPHDDGSNGWFAVLPPPKAPRALKGEHKADWVVIGAGYNGLGAARRLAELRPNDRILLLEARRVGYGAAGRNSGFAIDLPHNVDMKQEARCRAQLRLNRAALSHLGEVVERHKIACQWSQRGKLHTFMSERGRRAIETFAKGLEALGESYSRLNASEVASYLGTDYYKGGIITPGCVLMQPAALARGLGETLPGNVELCEETPAIAFDLSGKPTIETPQAKIGAERVIFATEAYTPALGIENDTLFTLYTFASLTRPLSDSEAARLGGAGDWGVISATPGGVTLRYTQDRRLLVRQMVRHVPGLKLSARTLDQARRCHEGILKQRFPMLEGLGFDHTWGGSICISQNRGVFCGKISDRVFGAFCQNGVGVTKGTITGRALAEIATGQDSDLVADMMLFPRPQKLPPEPLRSLGIRGRLHLEALRAGGG